MDNKSVDVVVSFDTTGSMYPCLTQVRRRVSEMVDRLFGNIPGLRVGIIAHGDYCDARSTYVTKRLELTSNREAIYRFVSGVPATNGGDTPECYELVLHEARDFKWGSGTKTLVLIGDDVPHSAHDHQNTDKLDWRNETELLVKMGVNVYGVQALNRNHATPFYQEIARMTGGFHLSLDQFSTVVDMIIAICLRQHGPESVRWWESVVANSGRMDRNLDEAFGILTGRRAPSTRYTKKRDLQAVPPGRFQVLHVDEDASIKVFVQDNGLIFNKGRGFYEFTKRELIQETKEVVLQDRTTGDFFGGNMARLMIDAPPGTRVTLRPDGDVNRSYRIFVRSDSHNRTLKAGTQFLYEVDRSR